MRDVNFASFIGLIALFSVAKYQAFASNEYLIRVGDSVQIRCPLSSVSLLRRFNSSYCHSLIADKSDEGFFLIHNVTLEDSDFYECLDVNGVVKKEICLLVTEIPKKPSNVSCITEPFLEYMQCCWNVSRSTGIPTTFSLRYMQKSANDTMQKEFDLLSEGLCKRFDNRTSCQKRSMLPLQCCRIKTGYNRFSIPSLDGYIYFELQAQSTNAFGASPTSDQSDHKHYPSGLVKPAQPRNVRAVVEEGERNTSIEVKWDKLDMAEMHLTYEVRYRKDGGSWQYLDSIHTNSTKFKLSKTYHDVDIQVIAKPSRTDSFAGIYSDWSDVTHIYAPTPDEPNNKALLGSIVFIGLIFVISTLVIAYRKRKKLKPILVGASDRRLPSPNIFIPLEKDEPVSSSNGQPYVTEQLDVQASNQNVSCLREESFAEINEPLLPNQSLQCDELPDYAGGIVQQTISNSVGALRDNDYNQCQLEMTPTTSECRENQIMESSTGVNNSTPQPSGGTISVPLPVSDELVVDVEESDYACSYSTVPGYLSCTSPQELEDNRSSSVETLTDYATF